MDLKRITFNFNLKNERGLKGFLYGKGAMISFLSIFAFLTFLLIFLFVEPFNMDLDSVLFRLFLLLLLSWISYSFLKTVVEIVVETDNIKFRILKKYREIPFKGIHLIKIHYSTWGTSIINIKAKGKLSRYYLWVPRHERERYELFLQLVETLKKKSKGKFEFQYKR